MHCLQSSSRNSPLHSLFLSLLEFDMSNIFEPNWGGTSIQTLKSCTSLRSVSLHCKLVQYVYRLGRRASVLVKADILRVLGG